MRLMSGIGARLHHNAVGPRKTRWPQRISDSGFDMIAHAKLMTMRMGHIAYRALRADEVDLWRQTGEIRRVQEPWLQGDRKGDHHFRLVTGNLPICTCHLGHFCGLGVRRK